jgi:N-succinyldiaminopimelate aminotransferase
MAPRAALVVCSPANPTGKVLNLDDWKQLFALRQIRLHHRLGRVLLGDLLRRSQPAARRLQAARLLGRGFERLVMFSSLSKRSNVPGMRSGFVAGDAAILKSFLLYRTYHGSAMSPAIQAASVAAWNDEAHVIDNRRQYREKFDAVTPACWPGAGTALPDASFYLWARTPISDTDFARAAGRRL